MTASEQVNVITGHVLLQPILHRPDKRQQEEREQQREGNDRAELERAKHQQRRRNGDQCRPGANMRVHVCRRIFRGCIGHRRFVRCFMSANFVSRGFA